MTIKKIEEKHSTANFKTILSIVLIFFVLNLVVNVAVSHALRYRSHNITYNFNKMKWKNMIELKSPVDTLILGDSTGNQGVIPDILNRDTGLNSFNFATNAQSGVLDDAWFLQYYIERHGAPKNVIIIRNFMYWAETPLGELIQQIPVSIKQFWSFEPQLIINKTLAYMYVIQKIFPLLNKRKLITFYLNPFLKLNDMNITSIINPTYVNDLDEKGFQPDLRIVEFEFQEPAQKSMRVEYTNQKALEKICSLAREHNINIILPGSAMYAKEYSEDLQTRLNQFKKDVDNVCPSIKLHNYIDQPLIFEKDEMSNWSHLQYPGAYKYTTHIAKIIKSLRLSPLKN